MGGAGRMCVCVVCVVHNFPAFQRAFVAFLLACLSAFLCFDVDDLMSHAFQHGAGFLSSERTARLASDLPVGVF